MAKKKAQKNNTKQYNSINHHNTNTDDTTKTKQEESYQLLSKKDLLFVAKFVFPILFILFAMWFAYDVRSGSANLEGLEQNIEQNLYQSIQQNLLRDINDKYPNLNQLNRETMLNRELSKVLETGVLNVDGQEYKLEELIEQQTKLVKAQFQTDEGQTYLTAIDPYFFYRLSLNLVETGTTGDKLIEGIGYRTHTLAPRESPAQRPEFHMWLGSKLIGDENKSLGEQFSSIFYISAILASLSVIPIFLLVRLYTNNVVALFSSLLLMSIGVFVSRTVTGFFDTDAYNVLFPLAIVSSIVYSLKTSNNQLTIFSGVLAGFFMGLFLWAWAPGWFIFVFILVSFIGYSLYVILSNFFAKKKLKDLYSTFLNEGIAFFSFLISSFVFTYFFSGKNLFSYLLQGIFSSLNTLASTDTGNIWPNVFTSVAELRPSTLEDIFGSIGGEIVLLLGLIGLVCLSLDFKFKNEKFSILKFIIPVNAFIWFLLMMKTSFLTQISVNSPFTYLVLLFLPVGLSLLLGIFNSNKSDKVFLTMIISIWLAGTIFMSLNGVRFILLLAPAVAIAFGFGLYYISQGINYLLQKEFSIKKPIFKQLFGTIVVSVLFLFIFSPIGTQAKQIGNSAMPNFDDAWYESMKVIRENTSESTIITSWWDFGHFFAAIADRPTTFDGATQTTPQSHWVGLLLMESDEEVSRDILRMLTCGGNQAFDTMQEISNDSTGGVHIVNLIKSTLGENQSQTRNLIENYEKHSFTQTQVDEIMDYLYCDNPRENILITSGDMVGKAGVWAHWGSWDFNKKYILDNQNLGAQKLSEDLDLNLSIVEQYISELQEIRRNSRQLNIREQDLINQWLAPYPGFQGTSQCQIQEQELLCDNGVRIDLMTGEIINKEQFQGASFKRVILPGNNDELEILPQDEEGLFDVLLIPNQGQFTMVLGQYPLGTSLFTRLFYLQGFSTTHFELLDARQTQTAGNLLVWRTNFTSVKNTTAPLDVNSIEYTITQEELEEMIANQEVDLNIEEEINSSN